jgi:hypothetical protein
MLRQSTATAPKSSRPLYWRASMSHPSCTSTCQDIVRTSRGCLRRVAHCRHSGALHLLFSATRIMERIIDKATHLVTLCCVIVERLCDKIWLHGRDFAAKDASLAPQRGKTCPFVPDPALYAAGFPSLFRRCLGVQVPPFALSYFNSLRVAPGVRQHRVEVARPAGRCRSSGPAATNDRVLSGRCQARSPRAGAIVGDVDLSRPLPHRYHVAR